LSRSQNARSGRIEYIAINAVDDSQQHLRRHRTTATGCVHLVDRVVEVG
jgi:hypothetical protein